MLSSCDQWKPLYDILEYLASGMTETEILEDFSEPTSADIKACLALAADRSWTDSDKETGFFT
ncbi:DUF433 domain-containing protein [Microcoleus sp.]|uniref:DUF433 domain-containing protein n=1 Tax=Microcoleus sp. TaxID=44472 RepID=UPI003C768979